MSNDLLRWRKESSPNEWHLLAQLVGTSTGYLNQIAYGNRRASPERAKNIEIATHDERFKKLRPVSKENLVFTSKYSEKTP